GFTSMKAVKDEPPCIAERAEQRCRTAHAPCVGDDPGRITDPHILARLRLLDTRLPTVVQRRHSLVLNRAQPVQRVANHGGAHLFLFFYSANICANNSSE